MLFSGSPRAHKTLRLDIGRGALEGLTQAGWQSLTLLILIEVFLKPAGDKGEMAQALMFGAGGGHAHLAAISCGLFILSILLLVPVIKHGRREE